jgi:hypothetical protein
VVDNIWKHLGGDPEQESKVPLKSIKVFMCGIQNFHIDWIIDHEREDVTLNTDKIGRSDE